MKRLLLYAFLALCAPGADDIRAQTQWTTPHLLNPAMPRNLNPYIAVGPNNEVTIMCNEGNPQIGLYRTTDRGASFTRTPIVEPVPAYYGISGQNICYDRDGALVVVMIRSELEYPWRQELIVTRSSNGGITFSDLWRRQQWAYLGQNYPLEVDGENTIHFVWDSSNGLTMSYVYTRIVNGNPNNRISRIIPRPDTTASGGTNLDMLVRGDTVYFVAHDARNSVGPSYYTRSTNGGVSFSPYISVDTLTSAPRLATTAQGRAIVFNHQQSPTSLGYLTLRLIVDSTVALSAPHPLPTLAGGGATNPGKVIIHDGKNFLTYTGWDGVAAWGCYYEFTDMLGSPTDSSLFSITTIHHDLHLAIDSLGGKYLVGTSYPQSRVYIATKDIATAVEEPHAVQAASRNSVSVSSLPGNAVVRISVRLARRDEGALGVYDILGREVSTMHIGMFNAGVSEFAFDSNSLAAGIYFAALKTRTERLVAKFLVIH